jgi:hypothetical protein
MRSAAIRNKRCSWVNADDPLLLEYHDREWGVPVHSDRKHFEVLVLSGAQDGLNWSLVLRSGKAIGARSTSSIPRKSRAIPRNKSGPFWLIRRSSATG